LFRPYSVSRSLPFAPFAMLSASGDTYAQKRPWDMTATASIGMEFGAH
jgi:hypothetical protein